MRFAPFGAEAQLRIASAHALIVGVGALGTHVAASLARAGVGRLTLVDRDIVDTGNLHRQVLFEQRDAADGLPKADAAAAAIARIDPELRVDPVIGHFDASLFERLDAAWTAAERPTLLIDGTDNFATRYVLNDLSHRAGLPWIHGAVLGAEGRAMVIRPGETPCLRCLLPEAPPAGSLPTCETAGVLQPAVAQVAAFQALEALKLLGGRAEDCVRGMFVFDAWAGSYDVVFGESGPREDCATCGLAEYPTLAAGEQIDDAVTLCGRDAVQFRAPSGTRLDLRRLAADLASHPDLEVRGSDRMVRLQSAAWKMSVFADARALIFGVDQDTARARALYDRYVSR